MCQRSSLRSIDLVGRATVGSVGHPDWALYFTAGARAPPDVLTRHVVSPWHNLPLRDLYRGPTTVTYVNEIPLGTRAKYEVSTKHPHNPIRQDRKLKDGHMKLRHFTYGDIPFNYGCLPRTWEDPAHVDPLVGGQFRGDGDPLDAVVVPSSALYQSALPVGYTGRARVVGALALIDEGEVDWKIFVALEDDTALQVRRHVPPSSITSITHWFEWYKTTDGTPKNEFGLGGRVVDEAEAMAVVNCCEAQYNGLTADSGLWLPNDETVAVDAITPYKD